MANSEAAYSQMITAVPIVGLDWTVGRAKKYFEENVKSFESIRYFYILGEKNKLLGIVSLKQLYSTAEGQLIKDIYTKRALITVKPDTNQGKVVYKALKFNIKSIPVVDNNNTFLGVVPSDKILSIAYHEARSILIRFAGINGRYNVFESIMDTPILASFRHRIPWLVIGILGGLFSAQIIKGFEATLERNLILASFIPLIVYISDAVRAQMEAYIIRELTLEEKFFFIRYLIKQLIITLLIGVSCGLILFFVVGVLQNNFSVASVIGFSVFCAAGSAIATGMVIPYGIYKLKIDPASASGPVATIIQDAISVFIYFSIASLLLR